MLVRTLEDVDRYLDLVRKAAADARAWMAAQTGDPPDMLRRMKFDAVGYHPSDGRALNLVEQINHNSRRGQSTNLDKWRRHSTVCRAATSAK